MKDTVEQSSRDKDPIQDSRRKWLVIIVAVMVVGVAVATVVPAVYAAFSDRGVQTADMDAGDAAPATESVDGHWDLVPGSGKNISQVGYTFDEILPGQEKSTSGRALLREKPEAISGNILVRDGSLVEGEIIARPADISSDIERRDIFVREKMLDTGKYPEARFVITEPVKVSQLPEDGSSGEVTVRGELTIKNRTESVKVPLQVLRTGDHVIIQGSVPVNRDDFSLESPDFIAAKIADEGTLDLLLVFQKLRVG